MKALLLSGGMDSTCIAYWQRPEICIFVDYGHRAAEAELSASRSVCSALGIRHEVVRVDCSSVGTGNMSGNAALDCSPVPEWWPYRNQLIITLAGTVALRFDVKYLLIGSLATDGEHADGRPEFISAMNELMGMQEGQMNVVAPAADLSAVELVELSQTPKDVLAWAHSCHISNFACGRCRGCIKHYQTWKALGWNPH